MTSTSNTKKRRTRCKEMESFFELLKQVHADGYHPFLVLFGRRSVESAVVDIKLFIPDADDEEQKAFLEHLAAQVNTVLDQIEERKKETVN